MYLNLIDFLRPHLAVSLLAGGPRTIVIANEGLWANRPAELVAQLDKHARPWLVRLAATPPEQRALVLWRETTPQHFAGTSRTGLYAERSSSSSSSLVSGGGKKLRLIDVLDTAIETLVALERRDESGDEDAGCVPSVQARSARYVWIEALACSQPLLSGAFEPQVCEPTIDGFK